MIDWKSWTLKKTEGYLKANLSRDPVYTVPFSVGILPTYDVKGRLGRDIILIGRRSKILPRNKTSKRRVLLQCFYDVPPLVSSIKAATKRLRRKWVAYVEVYGWDPVCRASACVHVGYDARHLAKMLNHR
jgi:hypothetical protein